MPETSWCIDIDGTLIAYDKPIEGATEFLEFLDCSKTPYIILTNTGERTAEDVSVRLHEVLQYKVNPERIFTALENMTEELLKLKDYKILVVQRNYNKHFTHIDMQSTPEEDESMTCIAVFSDGEITNYYSVLTLVANYIKRGAMLYVSSHDTTLVRYVNDQKHIIPGPGVFISALQCMVPNMKVKTFGKGSKSTNQIITVLNKLRDQGFTGTTRDIIMLGDRFDTDMEFGILHDTRTLLVESGCDTGENGHYLQNKIDMIASSIKDIPHSMDMFDKTTIEKLRGFMRKQLRHHLIYLSGSFGGNFCFRTVVQHAENVLFTPPRRIQSAPHYLNKMQ